LKTKSKYKSIKAEYFEKNGLIAISFFEKFEIVNWISIDQAKILVDQLNAEIGKLKL
jgi:hypothetical protein